MREKEKESISKLKNVSLKIGRVEREKGTGGSESERGEVRRKCFHLYHEKFDSSFM